MKEMKWKEKQFKLQRTWLRIKQLEII